VAGAPIGNPLERVFYLERSGSVNGAPRLGMDSPVRGMPETSNFSATLIMGGVYTNS
jgi:hypothetical protein